MSEPHVKRYMDGSMTTNAASTSSIIITTAKQSEVNNARHQVGSSPNGRDMSETSDFIGGVEDNNSVTTVGLEFVVDLPKRISTGVLAIRRVSCTAFVGDIYKAVTYANVSIVDRRWAKAVATVRTPSHLLHSSSKIIQINSYLILIKKQKKKKNFQFIFLLAWLISDAGSSGKWRSWNSTWIINGLVVFCCLFQLMRTQMSIVV